MHGDRIYMTFIIVLSTTDQSIIFIMHTMAHVQIYTKFGTQLLLLLDSGTFEKMKEMILLYFFMSAAFILIHCSVHYAVRGVLARCV